jgi:hypothetical protein
MQLIILSILFILAFCFVGIVVLSYAIYIWEKQKIDQLAQNITPNSNGLFGRLGKNAFTTIEQSFNNSTKMKFPKQVNEVFEKTLVVVKDQDYKGWLDKTLTLLKKVTSNLGLYTSYAYGKIIEITKRNKIHQEVVEDDEQAYKTDKENQEINRTADKISEITKNDKNQFDTDEQVVEITGQATPKSTTATLGMVTDGDDQKNLKDSQKDAVYEKIENSILARLKETGLSHYNIWIELAKHYEKYQEKEKAIEIYAMVMKHAEGKEKEIARDGLIALS